MAKKRVKKTYLNYLNWLRSFMMLFVRPTIPQTAGNLDIDPAQPVCYVLRTGSLSDSLVLDYCCETLKLPRPIISVASLFDAKRDGSVISLMSLGWLGTSRKDSRVPPRKLKFLLSTLQKKTDKDIQLVPVTVIWGRGPLSEQKSFFKAFFSDDLNAGIFQKLFIILYQGRNTVVQFGKPISLKEQLAEDSDVSSTATKLRRVLRVHFLRQRTGLIGPRTIDKNRIYAAIFSSKTIKDLIQSEAKKANMTIPEVEKRVIKILDEVVSDQKYAVIRAVSILLTWFWGKVFRSGIKITGHEQLFELSKNYEIIYAPNHRSHFDYLLHSYVLHEHGLPAPHIAAGINLNFWPVGRILRKAGAFFIRRQFKGDRLYAIVFREYLNYLIMRGHSISFYIEGGRSRTGRLLSPKTGMLGMIMQSYLRGTDRPVVIVPCYIGYDKVIEIRTYMRELSGKKKRDESFLQLLKVWKFLGSNFGGAYIAFGNPIYLENYMDQVNADWRDATEDKKPEWLNPLVANLSRHIMEDITRSTIVTPVSLVAVALLSRPQMSMPESELAVCLDFLKKLIKDSKYSPQVSVTDLGGAAMIKYVESLQQVRRFTHPGGDVIFLQDIEGFLLGYYRNNILHLLALPSLIASFFQHNDNLSMTNLMESCRTLFPFLRVEMFLPWDDTEFEGYLRGLVDDFVALGLLTKSGEQLERADVNSIEFSHLLLLGRTLGQTFDRFAVVAALLSKYGKGEELEREEFEEQSQQMAQRISLLAGKNTPELSDKRLFSNYIEILKKQGFVTQASAGKLSVDSKISHLYDCSVPLLGADMRQAIQRMRLEGGKVHDV